MTCPKCQMSNPHIYVGFTSVQCINTACSFYDEKTYQEYNKEVEAASTGQVYTKDPEGDPEMSAWVNFANAFGHKFPTP